MLLFLYILIFFLQQPHVQLFKKLLLFLDLRTQLFLLDYKRIKSVFNCMLGAFEIPCVF
jgi:hypothetical protein